ncbi:MAG: polysaccharide deacetylase family protein [Oscillospiraceae bacterium]
MMKCVFALVTSLAVMVGCGKAPENIPESLQPIVTAMTEDGKGEAGTSENEQTQVTGESTPPAAEDNEMSEDVKYIALTFDDGPNTTTTNDVLDKLEKHGIVASFFLVGNNITDESAKVVKRAYDMGCEINNHSRTHSDMTLLSAEEIQAEYQFVDDKVFEITGEHTKFFRPPYIAVHQIMFDNIDAPFIAGIGASDWEDRITAEKRAKTILKQAKDGDIILLHDMEGNSQTVEALDTIIPELQAQGYKFVTVSELFKAKGIDPDMEKVYTNVTQKYMYN